MSDGFKPPGPREVPIPTPDHHRNGKIVVVGFLIALVPFAWLTYRFNWLVDDAFISFRYAKHLAQGYGLRYNVGEDPPVEGYSNFLWVLVLAPFERIGWTAPAVAPILSVACGVVLVWRVTRFLRMRLDLAFVPLVLSALFFATLPPVAVWSTSGLATMPYTLLVFLTFELLLGGAAAPRGVRAGISAAALILIRVDGMIWVAGLIVLALLGALRRRDGTAVKPIAICTAIAAVVLVALTCFRLSYFGWPLPNTVYAKVGLCAMTLERGVRYVLSFLLVFPHLALLFAAVPIVLSRSRDHRTIGYQVAIITACAFGYAALVGGGWMGMGRFLIPAMPFVAILFAFLVRHLSRSTIAAVGCSYAAIVFSLLPAFNLHVVPQAVRDRAVFHSSRDMYQRESEYERWLSGKNHAAKRSRFGRALKKFTKPGESLIELGIGAIGYYTDLFIYDVTGLVNAEVAHRDAPRLRLPPGHDKMVYHSYFLKYRPTYYELLIVKVTGHLELEEGRRLRLGWDRPFRFNRPAVVKASYRPVGFVLPDPDELGRRVLLVLFMRKDLLYADASSSGGPPT